MNQLRQQEADRASGDNGRASAHYPQSADSVGNVSVRRFAPKEFLGVYV